MEKQDLLDRIEFQEFYEREGLTLTGRAAERKALCPFHDDHSPSLGVNVDTGFYNCPVCGAKGDCFTFYQTRHNCDFKTAMRELEQRYGVAEVNARKTKPEPKPEVPPIAEETAAKLAEAMQENANGLNFLHVKRGFSDSSIAMWQVGWCEDRKRISLPIRDAEGKVRNIRLYKPKSSGGDKWLSWNTGYGEGRLWPMDVLTANDNILLCEGEFDTILAFQHGFCAVTNTCGAETWKEEWNELFRGKVVTIAYDNDSAGRDGANNVGSHLSGIAASVRILQWPADMPEKGDITDWFVTLGRDEEEFKRLVRNARIYIKQHVQIIRGNGRLEDQADLLRNAVPEKGFLREYVDYASDCMDAPEIFHLFTGLATLAATCANKIKIGFGDGYIHPNLWTVLIAGSSMFRKSTALSTACKLLWQTNEGIILPNEFSPELLTASLADQPNGIFVWPEMKNALSTLNRSYMEGTKEFLTEIYDVPDFYRRKLKQSEFVIRHPTVSILGATTIDWLVSSVKGGDITGGFLARFIYVPAMEKSRDIALPAKTQANRRNALAISLAEVGKVEGEFDAEPIRHLYEPWYYRNSADLQNDDNAHVLGGFYSRLAVYALKIAMLLEVSKTRSLRLSEETMDQTFAIMDYLKKSVRYLIERELHGTKDSADLERVFRLIEGRKDVAYRDLLQRAHMRADNLRPLLETLVQSGRVKCENRMYSAC